MSANSHKSAPGNAYESVLALVALLLLVYFLWYPHPRIVAAALTLALAALLWPALAYAINSGWYYLTRTIGKVMSIVLLGGVYLLFITPLAVLYRLLGRSKPRSGDTAYTTRNHEYHPKDLQNPW